MNILTQLTELSNGQYTLEDMQVGFDSWCEETRHDQESGVAFLFTLPPHIVIPMLALYIKNSNDTSN